MPRPLAFTDDLMIAFAGNPLDRAEDKRGDADWLDAAKRRGRFLRSADDKVAMAVEPALDIAWAGYGDVAEALEAGADWALLGLNAEGVPYFAVAEDSATESAGNGSAVKFVDPRSIAMQIGRPQVDGGRTGIIAQALALLSWHARHRYCAACGEPTRPDRGGYQRRCGACATEHYPRTDPVAIMLAVKGDRCLLGRQPRFPEGMFSALAGFVEVGESLEAAVRRELHEEAGIHAGRVAYMGSQPWPFPSSLMLGFIAEAQSEGIVVDATEIEEARWFTAEEAHAALKGGAGGVFFPPPIAIAHRLIRHWLESL